MNNTLFYGWVICYLLSYLLNISLPFIDNDKIESFLYIISGILSLTALIIFIVWLTRYTNKKVLKIIWISALVTLIISIAVVIFLSNNVSNEIIRIPQFLLGYSITIFIGSFIGFLVRK